MGSGSGVTSFMITFAVPTGEDTPDIFLIDTRQLPWDGCAATLVRESGWPRDGRDAKRHVSGLFCPGVMTERYARARRGLEINSTGVLAQN